MKNEFFENIHICLSMKIISGYLAAFFLGIAFLMLIIGFTLVATISSAICLIILLISYYFIRRAQKYYQEILILPALVEMIFTMK